MKENYSQALKLLLVSEGRYTNDPHDPGGATNYGIIQTEYDAWREAQGLSKRFVRSITMAEVEAIYRHQYADPLHFDDLPAGLDYAVFDYGVNSGIRHAAQVLQRQVGTIPDGVIGLLTLAAVKKVYIINPADMISAYCASRLAFLMGLNTWRYFGRGWGSRVTSVKLNALKMIKGAKV